jgi:WD40 repeat protein
MEVLEGAGESDVRSFLQPADEPGSLGRLDHYRVLEEVGRGGMGVVYRAFDEKLRRVVALKVLSPRLASSPAARQRFTREARAVAAVNHPNVVTIHAVEDGGALPYLVMQLVDGPSLQQYLDRAGPLGVQEIVRIGVQIAWGLAAAHEAGVVHRDVKPANVLLSAACGLAPTSEEGSAKPQAARQTVPKITDFGLARAAADASLTQSGVIAGTPMYMAPEQARGEEVDHRADLFALGSLLSTLCTGRPPFRASSSLAVLHRVCSETPRPIRELRPDVPGWLCQVVQRLHAREPAQRFQSAREVAELLARRQAGTATSMWRRAWVAAAGLVVVVGCVAGFLLWPGKSGKEETRTEEEAFVPHRLPTAAELARRRSPLDKLKHEDVPPYLRAVMAGGDAARAPRELVCVLGEPRFLLPNSGPASWPALSPDGTVLAVPCFDCIVLFDARSGAPLRVLTGHEGRVFGVAFRPDGKQLAASVWGPRHAVAVWDLQTGKVVRRLTGHRATVLRVTYSSDGKRLASCSDDRTAKVWDADSGEELVTLSGHRDVVGAVCFEAGGLRIVTGSNDRTVGVWDAHGKRLATLTGHSDSVTGIAFSPDGRQFATGSDLESLLWDTRTLQKGHMLFQPGVWLAFSPDGKSLLTARHDHMRGTAHEAHTWDVRTGHSLGLLRLRDSGGIAVYQLGGDGKTLFALKSVPAATRLRVWDLATQRERSFDEGHTGAVRTVAIDQTGRWLASGGADGTVRLWDLAGRPGLVRMLRGHNLDVLAVAFSPDGKLLASGGADEKVVLWYSADGRQAGTLAGPSILPARLAFSPDGRLLGTCGADGTVHLWDVSTRQPRPSLPWHKGPVRAVAFSPQGRTLASGGTDGTVCLGEPGSVRPAHTFRQGSPVVDLAFSPDGRILASVSDAPGSRLRLWDVATRAEANHAEHEAGGVSLAFGPLGDRLVTAGRDTRLHLWERGVAGWRRARSWGPLGAAVQQVAITPEGRYLAVASASGCVYLLRLPPPGSPGP